GLVAVYLTLNVVVVARGLFEVATHPHAFSDWRHLLSVDYSNPALLIGAALLVFPKLALGLSGFETGVVVMPLVRGQSHSDLAGRIRNTRKLLTVAALI